MSKSLKFYKVAVVLLSGQMVNSYRFLIVYPLDDMSFANFQVLCIGPFVKEYLSACPVI